MPERVLYLIFIPLFEGTLYFTTICLCSIFCTMKLWFICQKYRLFLFENTILKGQSRVLVTLSRILLESMNNIAVYEPYNCRLWTIKSPLYYRSFAILAVPKNPNAKCLSGRTFGLILTRKPIMFSGWHGWGIHSLGDR